MKKPNIKSSRTRIIALVIVIFVVIGGVGYFVYNSQKKTSTSSDDAPKSQVETQETDNKGTNKDTNQTTPDNSTSTQGYRGTSGSSPPTTFTISSVKVSDPHYTYNKDKLGNTVQACGVDAQITVTTAGKVNYYWQTYHPQYFNPSSNGPVFSIDFTGAGTKTVSLDTYNHKDSRHFTLFITSPSSQSFETADQVWCP